MHPNHLDYEVKVGDQFPGFSPRVGTADLAPRAARVALPRASGPSGAPRGARRSPGGAAVVRSSRARATAGGPITLPLFFLLLLQITQDTPSR